jgi:hypothetical protein
MLSTAPQALEPWLSLITHRQLHTCSACSPRGSASGCQCIASCGGQKRPWWSCRGKGPAAAGEDGVVGSAHARSTQHAACMHACMHALPPLFFVCPPSHLCVGQGRPQHGDGEAVNQHDGREVGSRKQAEVGTKPIAQQDGAHRREDRAERHLADRELVVLDVLCCAALHADGPGAAWGKAVCGCALILLISSPNKQQRLRGGSVYLLRPAMGRTLPSGKAEGLGPAGAKRAAAEGSLQALVWAPARECITGMVASWEDGVAAAGGTGAVDEG